MDQRTDILPAQLHLEYQPSEPDLRRSDGSPHYHGEAAVDIIAVHGLASKYHRTWSIEQPDGQRYCWLSEQLPKDVPDARVLGFEYPSNWYDKPVHTRLSECGAQLLRCLVQDRCHDGQGRWCPTRRRRPIILMGHSFGGLVIKQALILASQTPALSSPPEALALYENHRDVLSSVAGIFFLGTPHRGSGFSVLADMQVAWGSFKSWFGGVKPHDELIKILQVDSMMVTYLQEEFQRLREDTHLSNLSIYCYYEMKPLPLPPHIVVNNDSACIDNSFARGMNANHMEMNKYHGPDDHNYRIILADIQEAFHQGTRTVSHRFESWKYGAPRQDFSRDRLQRWLEPSQEAQSTQFRKKLESQHSAPYTCQWIHKVNEFNSWSSPSSTENVLWINGKAGSGKSVLSAYLIDYLRSVNSNPAICHTRLSDLHCGHRRMDSTILYFLCGVDRSRETPEKMMGTLINQLLMTHCENEEMLQMALTLYTSSQERFGETPGWTMLVDLLLSMSRLAGKIFVIIDGIEENKTWKACLQALARLSGSPHVRILVSSQATADIRREWPEVFPSSAHLVITDHSQEDIQQFSHNRTTMLVTKKAHSGFKEKFIEDSILDGSQGMFQWVNAALLHLEEDVEDPDLVEQSFKDIPSELKATWERVFRRSVEKEDPQRNISIRTALQLLAVSGRPITLVEVKTAISLVRLGDNAATTILDPTKTEEYADIAEREIPELLGSLVDISNETGTVQLAHGSLLSALTSPEILRSSNATSTYAFALEEAHHQVAELCMKLCQTTAFVHANAFATQRPPFIEYAWDYWAYHFHLSAPTYQYEASLWGNFNKMAFGVSRDVVSYLDALSRFLSQPLRAVPGRFSDREYVLALQRAQDALLQPIADLTTLRRSYISTGNGLFNELETARKSLPDPSFQMPNTSSIFNPIQRTQEVLSDASKALHGQKTVISRIKLDESLERLSYLTKPSGAPKLMLEIARSLRMLTLRLAVDPVYSALVVSAGGQSFSPLHPLIYCAHLFEQAGSFPYWSVLAPHSDVVEAFICLPEDPEFAPAKFVLHCFEWRDRHRPEDSESVVGRYIRMNRIQAVEPNPRGHQLIRVSTENENQVRRLHTISGPQYYKALTFYRVFKPHEDHWSNFIARPLASLHMRKSLLLDDHDSAFLMKGPEEVLPLYAPESIQATPMDQYIIAIPQLLRVHFIHWFAVLLEVFGRISKRVLATHFARLEVASIEMTYVVTFFKRFRTDDATRLRHWYIVPGVLLFWLRCQYVPAFGSYYVPHTWTQFLAAWKHPAAYLDLQNVAGWKMWLLTVLRVWVYNILGAMAMVWGQSNPDASLGKASNVYATFHCLCAAERSIFGALTVIATLISCALVMMNDPDSLREMYRGSILYWFNVFFGLFMGGVQTGAVQNGGGVGAVFLASVLHVVMVIVFMWQFERIIRWTSFVLFPLTWLCMYFWRIFLSHYLLLAKLGGVAVVLGVAWTAISWSHKFIWDPYDIDGSLQKLLYASRLARSSIYPADYKQIGQEPLGDAHALQAQAHSRSEAALRHRAVLEELARREGLAREGGSRKTLRDRMPEVIGKVFASATPVAGKAKEE